MFDGKVGEAGETCFDITKAKDGNKHLMSGTVELRA